MKPIIYSLLKGRVCIDHILVFGERDVSDMWQKSHCTRVSCNVIAESRNAVWTTHQRVLKSAEVVHCGSDEGRSSMCVREWEGLWENKLFFTP